MRKESHSVSNTRLSFEARYDHKFPGYSCNEGRLALAIVKTVREPLLILDKDLRIVAANRSFYKTFAVNPIEIRGQPFTSLGEGQWDIPSLRERLARISPEHDIMEDYEVEHDLPVVGRRLLSLNARQVFHHSDTNDAAILLAIEDITARRAAEHQAKQLSLQKDLLLEEMRHRIANSLQIIASILSLKAKYTESAEARLDLREARERVLSIAAVQNHLQASGRNEPIAVAPYLSSLCSTLAQSMIGDRQSISFDVVAESHLVSSSDAVSLGLIVTEAVINSMKHAFSANQADGRITITYKVVGSDWRLAIQDNGAGKRCSEDAPKRSGSGSSIIVALAQQLKARVDLTSGPTGTIVSVTNTDRFAV